MFEMWLIEIKLKHLNCHFIIRIVQKEMTQKISFDPFPSNFSNENEKWARCFIGY